MTKKLQHLKGSEGFTLIEVIVTVVLLILGMLTIMGVFLGAAKSNSNAQKVDIAHHLAQETIEQFRNTRYIQINAFEGNYGDITGFPNHRREVLIQDQGTLKKVTVIVHFDNDMRSSRLISFFANI